jgi:cardiolipin synthase C
LKYFIALLFCCYGFASYSDDIYFLKSGADSLAARVQLIRQAKTQISFMTFEFEPCDQINKILINELVKKAQSGVKVNFLLDNYSISNSWKDSFASYLYANGIQLLLYNNNPGPLVLFKNHRNHIKLLVVDGEGYIVGGRNSRDAYFGLDDKLNYLDHDLLIYGPSAQRAQADFDVILKNYIVTRAKTTKMDSNFYNNCLANDAKTQEVIFWYLDSDFLTTPKPHSCTDISFGADDPRFLNFSKNSKADLSFNALKYKKSTALFLNFIVETKKSLVIENQYYIPVDRMDLNFKYLRSQKNIRIDIYTNNVGYGFGGFDKPLSYLMMSKVKSDAIGNQNIYTLSSHGFLNDDQSLTPPDSKWRIHTKSAVRDSMDVLISSFNIDPRSYHTNLEAAVFIKNCPELAIEISEDIHRLFLPAVFDHFYCNECVEENSTYNWQDKIKAYLSKTFL